jgi:heat shock protein HslJ
MNAPLKRLLNRALITAGLLTSLLFAGCSSPPPVNGNLSGSPTLRGWYLVQLYGDPVTSSPLPTLSLYEEGGKNVGHSGVNSYSFEFLAADGGMKAGPIISTKMAGTPEQMETEAVYFAAIEEANGWRVGSGTLELISHQGVIARFSKTIPVAPSTSPRR